MSFLYKLTKIFHRPSSQEIDTLNNKEWRTLRKAEEESESFSQEKDKLKKTSRTKIETLIDLESTIRLSVKDMASAIKTTLSESSEKDAGTDLENVKSKENKLPEITAQERAKTPVKPSFETLVDLQNTIRLSVKDMVTAVKSTLAEPETSKQRLPLPNESLAKENTSSAKNISSLQQAEQTTKNFKGSRSTPLDIKPTENPYIFDRSPEKDFATYTPFSKFFIGVIALASITLIGSILIGSIKIIQSGYVEEPIATSTSSTNKTETASSATSLGYMISTAKSFLASKTQADLLENIREPEIVGTYVYDYYRNKEINFTKFFFDPANHTLTKLKDGHSAIFRVKNNYGDVFPLCVIQKKGFEPKVDWESFVNFSELSWDELLKRKPRSPTLMRAVIEPGTYYNYLYQDDKWQCFRLSDPEQFNSLFIYAKKNSFASKQTIKKLRSSPNLKKPFALGIFRIFFEDGARPNQARLDEVINFGLVREYQ